MWNCPKELRDFRDFKDLSDLKDFRDFKDFTDLKDFRDLRDLRRCTKQHLAENLFVIGELLLQALACRVYARLDCA